VDQRVGRRRVRRRTGVGDRTDDTRRGLCRGICVATVDDDTRALCREERGDLESDTAGTADDDGAAPR